MSLLEMLMAYQRAEASGFDGLMAAFKELILKELKK